jgi:hypothetical protein
MAHGRRVKLFSRRLELSVISLGNVMSQDRIKAFGGTFITTCQA